MPSATSQPRPTVVARDVDPLPLPLPAPGWGAADAHAALELARGQLPLQVGPADEVLGLLTTVVLGAGQHVVKVYPPGTDAAHLDRIHAALAGSRTATTPLVPAAVTPHGVVTVAARLSGGCPVTWPEAGRLLRDFHAEHAGADVAPWSPLSRLESQAEVLPEEDAEVLRAARDGLLSALAGVRSELGHGVIHGDVSPSNVMHDGIRAALIDLDWVAVAPREYDLASASRRFRAGELDRQTYRDFCAAYGHDVLGWEGLPLLDRIADLAGVVFRIWDCRHHGRDLDWLPAELGLWHSPL
ncbi:phosphotransferase [Terrabacter sp. NPDC080008]|uniref:phosphotransferase enzyme family protein n=1 Tax=Terrabacter sp. NPDC080008 TaxID=3155176 RepID=UPI00344E4574